MKFLVKYKLIILLLSVITVGMIVITFQANKINSLEYEKSDWVKEKEKIERVDAIETIAQKKRERERDSLNQLDIQTINRLKQMKRRDSLNYVKTIKELLVDVAVLPDSVLDKKVNKVYEKYYH